MKDGYSLRATRPESFFGTQQRCSITLPADGQLLLARGFPRFHDSMGARKETHPALLRPISGNCSRTDERPLLDFKLVVRLDPSQRNVFFVAGGCRLPGDD